MCRYYGYTRVSTETQVESGYGLDTQKNEIENYAEKNGIEITEYFTDEGVSGTIYERPGLTALISVLEQGDKIIVWETSRLWREDFVRATLVHTLKNIGCEVISVSQPNFSINTDNPSDFLISSILTVLDEYDRILIVRKLQAGRKTKAKSGSKACGTAPIGYCWTADRMIAVDPETAPMIQDIFDAYLNLGSLSKLIAYCDDNGYVTQRGGSFSKASLHHILKNTFYVGVVSHAGNEYDGVHEAIIDEDTFNEVQELLNSNMKMAS